MKRLFVLSLVAVLSVGLLSVGAFAQVETQGSDQESATTTVYWEYDGVVNCEVSLTGHSDVDLGDSTSYTDTLSESGNWLTTNGNCDYELTVTPDTYDTPIDSAVFESFGINLDSATGATSNADYSVGGYNLANKWGGFDWGSFSYEDGSGSKSQGTHTVGVVTTSEGNYQEVNWNMQYKYDFEQGQDENGDYAVDLTYTVSTQD